MNWDLPAAIERRGLPEQPGQALRPGLREQALLRVQPGRALLLERVLLPGRPELRQVR